MDVPRLVRFLAAKTANSCKNNSIQLGAKCALCTENDSPEHDFQAHVGSARSFTIPKLNVQLTHVQGRVPNQCFKMDSAVSILQNELG